MSVKYLNLEYWFFQIYLLTQWIYDSLAFGPQILSWLFFKIVCLILGLLFLYLFFYSVYKTKKIRDKEKEEFMAQFTLAADPKTLKSEEWQDILDHIGSENESQWKLALIDADKILENLLREAGFSGEGVGEMLKKAEAEGRLRSLQDAWQAHKIRNRIAHEVGFVLTKREAKVAVESYKKAFEELGFF